MLDKIESTLEELIDAPLSFDHRTEASEIISRVNEALINAGLSSGDEWTRIFVELNTNSDQYAFKLVLRPTKA